MNGFVDEAHCCDTSRSLRVLIGRHSKVTSRNKGENPHLWSNSYRSDVSIQIPAELASLACTLWYSQYAYWVRNTHSHKMRIAWQSTIHSEGRTRHRFATALSGLLWYFPCYFTAVFLRKHLSTLLLWVLIKTHQEGAHRVENFNKNVRRFV